MMGQQKKYFLKKSKNLSPFMVKFRKDEEQKEEYQDTIFKHSVNI